MIEMNERTTMGCRFIEGAKFELKSFKSKFDTEEHAIWQATAIAQSIKAGPYPVFVTKVDDKFIVSLSNNGYTPLFAII